MWRNAQCDEMGYSDSAWWILMSAKKLPIRVCIYQWDETHISAKWWLKLN